MVASPVLNTMQADAKRRDCNSYKKINHDVTEFRVDSDSAGRVEMVNLELKTG